MSHVKCHLSPIINANSHTPEPQTIPLLTPPLHTVGWFTKTEPQNPIFFHNPLKEIATKKCFSQVSIWAQRLVGGERMSVPEPSSVEDGTGNGARRLDGHPKEEEQWEEQDEEQEEEE